MTRESDPARLLRSGTYAGRLLRDYAKRTTHQPRVDLGQPAGKRIADDDAVDAGIDRRLVAVDELEA